MKDEEENDVDLDTIKTTTWSSVRDKPDIYDHLDETYWDGNEVNIIMVMMMVMVRRRHTDMIFLKTFTRP